MFADTIVSAELIRTMHPRTPVARAMAIKGGRVIALASDPRDLQELRGSSTRLIDAKGATITPGLIDGHIHPISGLDRAASLDLGGITTLEQLRRALHREATRLIAESSNDVPWLQGWNLDYTAFEGQPLHADLINEAALGLPVCLTMFDGHTVLTSRKALEIAGITGTRHFPDASVIVVDKTGTPTGELREDSAFEPIYQALPPRSLQQRVTLGRELLGSLAAKGITGGTIMNGDHHQLDLLQAMEETGELPVRLVVGIDHRPGMTPEDFASIITTGARRGRDWQGGLIKLFLDGVIDTGTAWLYEPDLEGAGGNSFYTTPGEYTETVRRYSDAGFQIATHAIGDKAIGAAIDAYSAAGVAAPGRGPHRIEHLECLADVDLPRLATHGITASMQPLHMQWRTADRQDSWSRRLDPARQDRAWRTRDVLNAGALLVFGSDWPVAQYDTRIGMAWARLRRTPGNPDAEVFEPAQRLTGEETLRAFTRAPALAQGELDTGHLGHGARADFAIWAQDPVTVPADELITTDILHTWKDGTPTFIGA
ncbi:amidohydrolase [Arthrobacter sp. RAF14]|uniref:amidohydrolase n=1 Tax=Arthrobacter sp. RAF14 TaxID=3233051 RepID=UPI003F8EAFCD